MTPDVRRRCRDAFTAPWGPCDIDMTDVAAIGAHSHIAGTSLRRSSTLLIAADGEASLYTRMAASSGRLWTIDGAGLELSGECRGNIAVWDEATHRLMIANEWTGSFPLYYAHRPQEGFLFSSRMSVIASVIKPSIDGVGLVEFLREASFHSSRSLWADVHRLQPGQSLVYDAASDVCTVTERSRLWTSIAATRGDIDRSVEEIWSRLGNAMDVGRPESIMMSGGWDSRTLLARAAASSPPENLLAYSHGDPASREIRLAQCLAGESGIAFHQEPIDHRCYDVQAMRTGFEREEHVVFPHWHRAGTFAAQAGRRVVTAGVYGEVLGGHYGRAMLLQGAGKIREVLRGLLGRRSPQRDATPPEVTSLVQFLQLGRLDRPWPIREEWWREAQIGAGQINADIDHDIGRLRDRGVRTIDQLIEAFVSEHRGSQYINAQLRSCRAYTDVSLPFAERKSLESACALPLGEKIHNRMSQRLLRRFAPGLLHYPLAATLADAGRPLMVQEASRFLRKGLELGRWRAHLATSGRLSAPRLSWVNFEFLRSGGELSTIIDDLRADLWDRAALVARADQLARDAAVPAHPLSDQIMKVYTIDLALRSA